MQVVTRRLATDTKGPSDIVDITGPVARELQSSGLSSGTVTLFVTGSTAALTIIEHEPGLLRDFPVNDKGGGKKVPEVRTHGGSTWAMRGAQVISCSLCRYQPIGIASRSPT